jgi:aspartyl-tRNA(Asn)/glutamyl-tRNA(Gln) amidotransferase subunit B
MTFKITIGLEIHVELTTKHKLFSNALVSLKNLPNNCITNFDLAYPGTMPIVNKKAIQLAIITCHFLHAHVNSTVTFDRKHYFYPDLPKGFQITQKHNPIGKNGYLKLDHNSKTINILQIQLEEDTAKQFSKEGKIYLDFNRCGIGLLEIVTAPDFENGSEVIVFLTELQFLLRYYKISKANMHDGMMRCDVNISLSTIKNQETIFGPRVELKNLNSLQFIEKGINFEIQRQQSLFTNDQFNFLSETRKFNENLNITESMREKDTNLEYCYLIEPNIQPIKLSSEFLTTQLEKLPLMPDVIKKELLHNYKFSLLMIEQLSRVPGLLLFIYQYCKSDIGENHSIANLFLNDISAYFNKQKLDFINYE